MMDYNEFFSRKAEVVAKDLLGRLLIKKTEEEVIYGQIIETGAYEGGKQTPSRKGMNYAPRIIFLMPYRGHYLFNIATEREGKPSCIELRAISTSNGIITGSGRISNFFGLSRKFDGSPLAYELSLSRKEVDELKIIKSQGNADNCLGYFSIK